MKKDFTKELLFQMVLNELDSVFDLGQHEIILLPHNYKKVMEELLSDDLIKVKYQGINVSMDLDGLDEPGITIAKREKDIRVDFYDEAISSILSDKTTDFDTKMKVNGLALDYTRRLYETCAKELLKVGNV